MNIVIESCKAYGEEELNRIYSTQLSIGEVSSSIYLQGRQSLPDKMINFGEYRRSVISQRSKDLNNIILDNIKQFIDIPEPRYNKVDAIRTLRSNERSILITGRVIGREGFLREIRNTSEEYNFRRIKRRIMYFDENSFTIPVSDRIKLYNSAQNQELNTGISEVSARFSNPPILNIPIQPMPPEEFALDEAFVREVSNLGPMDL